MKRILVCGSNGLLGQKLAWLFDGETDYEILHTSHHRAFAQNDILVDYTMLDISNRSDVKSLVAGYRPDVIINAAAMTNVDNCEKERELAWKINVTGVENLVEVSRRINAKLVHISTDYVFDGKTGNYSEEDRVHPINYYGKTKLAGENAVIAGGIEYAILRTVLVYGAGVNVKNNFALWVVNNLLDEVPIRCADDQISSPTNVFDLATAVKSVIDVDATGLYHISGPDAVSRYDFALKAADIFGLDSGLISRVRSADLGQFAARPLHTSLRYTKAKNVIFYNPMNTSQGLMLLQQDLTGISLN